MRIDAGASSLFADRKAQETNTAREGAKTSFDALIAGETGRAAASASVAVEQADFTTMTRQQMRDWMNEQMRSGNMTVDESSTFLAMTALVYIGPDGPVLAEDRIHNERVNFFEIARNVMDFYLSRGDRAAADRWQDALTVMEQAQGQSTRFDARV